MDFVTALGQFKAQFSGDDAAAAIRRIAGNPDFHGLKVPASSLG
jgi:hypothetical protein